MHGVGELSRPWLMQSQPTPARRQTRRAPPALNELNAEWPLSVPAPAPIEPSQLRVQRTASETKCAAGGPLAVLRALFWRRRWRAAAATASSKGILCLSIVGSSRSACESASRRHLICGTTRLQACNFAPADLSADLVPVDSLR
ncbi:hypothetical protein M409DRAFT_58957 [Zasmidium cellare ATCC 36951]|uniref:Uncharacterized protein n=1 Tax=Zasmidium cellare ATCC 36951 TaxID=1080233 RepID=A0A6A6C735_ZASCE|nr:uncharacterized protein M409DRAFT_58957 [Zasmidium cellare ATCC 36951]KAF2161559.1 hypothetical protein M409DRAFT_58957 [Zasmidium cellare ATCC 36951]